MSHERRGSSIGWVKGKPKACCRNLKTTTRPGRLDPIRARGRRRPPAVDRGRAEAGDAGRRLRPEEGAGLGRRRDRLRGAPPDPRPARGGQGAAPPAGVVAADGRALRAGSARRQHDQAPEHRRHLRVRRAARRAAVLRDGAARGHRPAVDPERARAASRRARCWRSSSRSARRCRRRTTWASSTAISRPATSSSPTVDGQRVVKLLDFGIAKLMHPDAGEGGLTVVGTRLGTSYTMAPEQIRGDGVDAAHRHLRAGRRALPPADGAVPVPRRDDDRHRAAAPGSAAAAAQPGGAACRPRWTRSCCAAWRRPPSGGSRRSRRSSRRCATPSGSKKAEPRGDRPGRPPSSSRSGSPTAPTPRATRCSTTRPPSSTPPSTPCAARG